MSRTPGAKDKQKRKSREDRNRPAWSKSPIIQDQNPDLPDGYNAKMIQFMLDITPPDQIDLWDVRAMEQRFANYLRLCAERDIKVGNMAAYYAIGLGKDTARDWLSQDPQAKHERTRFIKKVQQICAFYRENLMGDGKINPVTGIFWQKNYDGLKDQQEQIIVPANPLGDSTDSDTLRRRYLEQKEPELIAESAEIEKLPQKVAERDLSGIPAPQEVILESHLGSGSDSARDYPDSLTDSLD